ncbi:MAG: 2OG-Fe(II) oxygenase [Burkholderiales bacterium]
MLKIDKPIRSWILDNLGRGCTLDSMVDSLAASGHPRAYAQAAVAQVVAEQSVIGAPAGTGPWQTADSLSAQVAQASVQIEAAQLAAARAAHRPVAVPEPIPNGSPAFIETNDRKVAVLTHLVAPRVIVFGGVFSDAECDELVEMSRVKVERSLVVNPTTGTSTAHAERTSEGTFFYVNENPLVARLDRRIGELLRWPVERGEGLQILHYTKGGEYRPHFDYFDPAVSGSAAHIAKGGNRVATLVVYLATADEGGATIFPDIGFSVAPIKGNAVFFSYDIPAPASLTLHGGAPVERGEKWIATKWLRAGPYR